MNNTQSDQNKEPNTYRFSTFQELVDRVPSNRIHDCMDEIGELLQVAKLSTEMAYDLAVRLARQNGKEPPLATGSVILLPNEFEWIDDGKRELEATMTDGDGNPHFSVSIKTNQHEQHTNDN